MKNNPLMLVLAVFLLSGSIVSAAEEKKQKPAPFRIRESSFVESRFGRRLERKTFQLHENVTVRLELSGFKTDHTGYPRVGIAFEIIEIADSSDSEKNPKPVKKTDRKVVLLQKTRPVELNERVLTSENRQSFSFSFPIAPPLHEGKKTDTVYIPAKYVLRIYASDNLGDAKTRIREMVFWVGKTYLSIVNLRLTADRPGEYEIGRTVPKNMNAWVQGTVTGLTVDKLPGVSGSDSKKGNEFKVHVTAKDAAGKVLFSKSVAENAIPTRKHFLKKAPVTFRLFFQFSQVGKKVKRVIEGADFPPVATGLVTLEITVEDVLAEKTTSRKIMVEVREEAPEAN